MRRTLTDQAGLSPWAVVAILAVLAVGFFVMLGIGGVAWYLIAHRPTPAPTGPLPRPSPPAPYGSPAPAPQPRGPVRYAHYIDPDAEFAVDYPETWQVHPWRQGVNFFPPGEDPRHGTLAFFSKALGAGAGRLVPGKQLLNDVVQGQQSRYPDFRVVRWQVRPGLSQGTEEAYLEAVWTNARGERMHGAAHFTILHSYVVRTSMWYMRFYRSQEVAWSSLLPVFEYMVESYKVMGQAPGPWPSPSPTPTP
ncbi:MAG: hypothetical protein QN202_07920 [Armatimonadota bacterium]|nr:hypothetical protein [Armatimonadota bacterium]